MHCCPTRQDANAVGITTSTDRALAVYDKFSLNGRIRPPPHSESCLTFPHSSFVISLPLSPFPRCCLCPLPPFVSVGLIDQFAATPSAEHVSAAAFRRRDPTAAFTLHDIAWRSELQIMTSATGTANSERFCPPHVVVMMMGFTHERVGNFVKNRVQDLLLWGSLRKFV